MIIQALVRPGAYYDSVTLMQVASELLKMPGVEDAALWMGTEANKGILAVAGLLTPEVQAAANDDLIIAVKAQDDASAQAALAQVDELLTRRRRRIEQEYRPQSLESAAQMLPDAQWVLVSVAGHYAAGVARQALRLGKNVFLYSDNVSLDDEVALKQTAAERGLLVMGPDCGTAIVNGVGLGFANRVRQGPIGLVAAAGTGLQQVSARLHQLGSGITHALGTGGRDLSQAVGAVTAHQGLDLLSRDPETRVIVLVSKPPSPQVAEELLKAARSAGKPVVVDFIGHAASARQVDNLHFATTLDEAADLAVQLATATPAAQPASDLGLDRFAPGQRYLRGLFSGGTLAYEALLILRDYLPAVYSNAPLGKDYRLADSLVSQAHTIVDLGEDEFTVGRLHPMMDNDLRIRRLQQEADDPEVAVLLLDVVLGYGVHPDPAGELGPAIARARSRAAEAGRYLEVVAVVVGTDEDPQGLDAQVQQLEEAGARVDTSNEAAVRTIGRLLQSLNPTPTRSVQLAKPVNLDVLHQPLAAINVGLESFAASLEAQGAPVIQVDWRPPAGGNEKLMAILERMKMN
ncbi:MAG: acyl-CoA synthetase FdrA [Chloroflexi bacterium]|nr:acyl-CoA synthetase FdrA [Chloroflexota bacterium]MBU1751001.1 acyl-CoA synthetase FdrA [Chloroflexota bacterium]